MSGQHRADSDTTWQRRIAVGPTLARIFVLAGIQARKKPQRAIEILNQRMADHAHLSGHNAHLTGHTLSNPFS